MVYRFADTAMCFSSVSLTNVYVFFEWSHLTVVTSPVGSAAFTCTSQGVLAAVDRDTNCVAALTCLVVDRPTSVWCC